MTANGQVNGRKRDASAVIGPQSSALAQEQTPWLVHIDDAPEAPPVDNREQELAALAAQEKLGHDGKRQRVRARRTVDYFGGLERWRLFRTTRASFDDRLFVRADPSFIVDLLAPSAYPTNASTSFCTRYAHTSTNKIRCPVNVVRWMPDARRVLTGSTSGEFTLWNGLTFNFETILQAHDTAVRAMEWSHNGVWLVSADNGGMLKYFQTNMNNLQMFRGHRECIRDITFAPNDMRFATGSDDGTVKLWNFEQMKEEKTLTGHGWDVRCVKWHPTKGLLVSGSKDNLVKFWDPRTSQVVTTLHGHKNTVQACSWSPNGNMVATASRDQLIKVFDIRAMKELVSLRGHDDEACSVAWHPVHEDMLVSGGSEGSILHWTLPDPAPKEKLTYAHDSNIWSMTFHPLGHVLVSASNDHTTKFWSRNRPGVSSSTDRYHIGREKAREMGDKDEEEEDEFALPGLHGSSRGGGGGGGDRGHHALPPPSMGGDSYDGDGGGIPGFGGGHQQRGPPSGRAPLPPGYGNFGGPSSAAPMPRYGGGGYDRPRGGGGYRGGREGRGGGGRRW